MTTVIRFSDLNINEYKGDLMEFNAMAAELDRNGSDPWIVITDGDESLAYDVRKIDGNVQDYLISNKAHLSIAKSDPDFLSLSQFALRRGIRGKKSYWAGYQVFDFSDVA